MEMLRGKVFPPRTTCASSPLEPDPLSIFDPLSICPRPIPHGDTMQCRSLILILCLFSSQIAAEDVPKHVDRPLSLQQTGEFQYDGIWKPKGTMLAGVLFPPPVLEAITLRIEKDTYEVTIDGEEHSDKGTFTLDETATPKRMTIKSTASPNKGKTILAIYEIKNADAMRVCYELSGTELPKEFKAPKNSELYLVGYCRQRPDAKDASIKPTRTLETQ